MNVGSHYPISRFRGSRQNGTTIYNNVSTYNYHIFATINSELICKIFLILKICVIKYSSYIGTLQTAHHSNDNKIVPKWLKVCWQLVTGSIYGPSSLRHLEMVFFYLHPYHSCLVNPEGQGIRLRPAEFKVLFY